MRELSNRRGNVRNYQGGWQSAEDEDAFDTAARKAFEEINPTDVNADTWKSEVSNRLRTVYTSENGSNLSVELSDRTVRWRGESSVKTRVSIRFILHPKDSLLTSTLVEKEIGIPNVTGDFQWVELSTHNANRSHAEFTFNAQDVDISTSSFHLNIQYQDLRRRQE